MPKLHLKVLHKGNANLVFQVEVSHENCSPTLALTNEVSYWEKRLWRVCQKFEYLSKNNDYTRKINYPYLKEELPKDNNFQPINQYLLDYELVPISLDDIDAHSKKLLKKYVPFFDQHQIWGFRMPNLLPFETCTGKTIKIDHFSKLHDFSTGAGGDIEMIWECKPKWGYYNQARPQSSWFCRNCCLNFVRQGSRKAGKICYSQTCEFRDVSVLQQCLDESNVEQSLHKKILNYFISSDSVVKKVFQAQYVVLKGLLKNGAYRDEDDSFFMQFFDSKLMLLRDVTCFIEFSKSGEIKEYIVDIDYKQIKLDKWKEKYEELCNTAEKVNMGGSQQHMALKHTLIS